MSTSIIRTLSCVAVSVLLLCIIAPLQPASALSFNDINDINNDMPWYDETPGGVPCELIGTDLPNGTPEQNGQSIYSYLTAESWLTQFQAAGVIGNMMVESGLQPQRLQGTRSGVITRAEDFRGSSGWGLVQWTPGSKYIDEIDPIAQANNLGTQLGFLKEQLEGNGPLPEKRAGEELKGTPNLEEAVVAFQGNKSGAASPMGLYYFGYERPKDQTGSVKERTDYAVEALAKYGSGTTTPSNPADGPCGGGGSGQLVGGMAFPVDTKWYESNPNWFTKPHHDYPSADIPIPTGTAVYSMTAGKIIKAPITKEDKSYGQGVMIDAGNGILFVYAHGSDGGSVPGAAEGNFVQPGQLIMHSASTGHSTGPHLHLEIRVNGNEVCPQSLLEAIGEGRTTLPEIRSLPTSGCTY